ncbi:MAG: hypothetical protein PHZ19_12020 [Candidatus Thermoplasmatota archaeon]|nr:hypothetical protein [Candidatus Thermoplasmatota archaeon]
MEGESLKQYEAFRVYRDLGSRRSVAATARLLSRSPSTLANAKANWNWDSRCREWDAHLAAVEDEGAINEKRDMAARHIALAHAIQDIIWKRLDAMDAGELAPRDIQALLKLSVDIERISMGQPTEHSQHDVGWEELLASLRGR